MPASAFLTNISDPILVKVLIHLDELVNSTNEPKHKLIQQAEAKLRTDSTLYDPTNPNKRDALVGSFFPKILQVIRSDYSTLEAKNSSISLLNAILLHFDFEQIVTFFDVEQLIEAMTKGNEELKLLAIGVVSRAKPADLIANTPILLTLFQLLRDPETSLRLVTSITNCVVTLATDGELVRRRILSNEIVTQMKEMRDDPKVDTRLFDLVVELLPVIPDLPEELFLVSKNEFVKSDDLLHDSVIVSFYSKLIDSISLMRDESSQEKLLEKLDEQVNYITKIYLDDTFKPELKLLFSVEPVIFLSKLSQLFHRKFQQLNTRFKILDHAIAKYQVDECSWFLLSNINPDFLKSKTEFIKNLPLNEKYVSVYANLISNKELFTEKLALDSNRAVKLTVDSFLGLMVPLTLKDYGVAKLVDSWPELLTRLLDDIKDVRGKEIWDLKIECLENLLKHYEQLGIWEDKVKSEYLFMKKGKTFATPAVDVMDASG
ncbi:unnamed protein product [Ambrosiozyma monospora]|uniref:Unnamed protein product n=1 Tax=Ambrosiozyma monospora TaxID=43982 RepID=A0A9W6YTM8_AMBMO|nr:unnamed protein product [Ambrosiozyma monospora]